MNYGEAFFLKLLSQIVVVKFLVNQKYLVMILLFCWMLGGIVIEKAGAWEGGLPRLILWQSMTSQIGMEIADSTVSKNLLRSKRAPGRHVGAVMAILGTFHDAGILPSESDPRANQLIRSLIQFQSVFMKSQEPAVDKYFSSALTNGWGERGAGILESFYNEGWTSESLEAIVEYSLLHSMWDRPRVKAALRVHHLAQADWELIQELFFRARKSFINQNQDLHIVFKHQRLGFPGGEVEIKE